MDEKERAIEIARRLKELRGIRPKTKLARELKIGYTTYCNFELGLRVPKDPVKMRIAQYYGKTVGEIFFPDDNA